jgi:hypothetical protein
MFYSYLEFRTMDKVQKTSNSDTIKMFPNMSIGQLETSSIQLNSCIGTINGKQRYDALMIPTRSCIQIIAEVVN